MKTYVSFCTYLEFNLQSIYHSKKCFEQKLWRKMEYTFGLVVRSSK